MNRALATLATLAPLCVGALVLSSNTGMLGAAPAAAALGPGGIVELHERLFEALDKFDGSAAREVLDVDRKGRQVIVFLDDGSPTPITGRTRGSAGKALEQWSHATGNGTRIVSSQVECPSSGMSYAVFELERIQRFTDGSAKLRRFRSTSLVRATDQGWKLFHWHVSPAEDDGQPIKG